MSLLRSLTFALVVLLSAPQFAAAQLTVWQEGESPVEPVGNLNCFDFYEFGSVAIEIEPQIPTVAAGTQIGFAGELTNNNDYPIVNGSLFARVFRVDDALTQQADGNIVVDEFLVLDDINFAADEEVLVEHNWTVPKSSVGGDYYIGYYFIANERHSVSGLQFTEDVVGGVANFSVVTETGVSDSVVFDKGSLTLNGEDYAFTNLPPVFEIGGTVRIEAKITNLTDEKRTMPLQWNQYSWDSFDKENIRHTETKLVSLEPNETKTVSYEVRPQREAVVYVTGILQNQDVKNYINVRFVQDGAEDARLHFPMLTDFPIAAGEEVTMLTCAHTLNNSGIEDLQINLELLDEQQNQIESYTYEGDLNALVSGFGSTFTVDRNINAATLRSTLLKDESVIEEVVVDFDCENITGSECFNESFMQPAGDGGYSLSQMIMMTVGVVVLLLIIVVVAVMFRKKGLSSLLLFVALGLLSSVSSADAASTAISGSHATMMTENGVFINMSADYTILYHADVYDETNSRYINSGDTLEVGTIVRIEPKSRSSTPAGTRTSDISWNFTGEVAGTPLGAWGGSYATGCTFENTIGSGADIMGQWSRYYAFLTVALQSETIQGSGVSMTDLGSNRYRLDSVGTADFAVAYPTTTARWNMYRNAVNYAYYGEPKPRVCSPVSNGALTFSVPNEVVPFSFNVVNSANQAPNAPTITGPSTGDTGTSYSFTFQATDPDGDQVAYEIDWLNSGSASGRAPTSGYVNSGTSRTSSYSWSNPGSQVLRARTIDANGAVSAWTSHTISLSNPPVDSMSGTGCVIASGESTCNGQASWNFSSASNLRIYNDTHVITYYTNLNPGVNEPVSLEYGTNRVVAYDDTTLIDFIDLVTTCASGSSWNGSTCTPSAPSTCSPVGSYYEWNGASWAPSGPTVSWNWDIAAVGGTTAAPPNQPYDEIIPHGMDVDKLIIGGGGVGSQYVCGGATLPATCTLEETNLPDGTNITECTANTPPTGSYQNCPASWADGSVVDSTHSALTGSTNNTCLDRKIDMGPSYCGFIGLRCATAPVTPSVDLTINGSDGPLSVNSGDTLNLSWTSTGVSSCVAYGAGWASGTAVPVSGTDTVSVTTDDTYIISCDSGSYIDSVDVTVTNSAPNAPTITGPASGITNTSYSYAFQATDPDGDDVYYEVDWNNDGTPDNNAPLTGFVSSGNAASRSNTWTSTGSFTIQARTVDSNNARSSWTQYAVTISPAPVPAPVAAIDVSVNGGSWTSSDQTITPGDTVAIRWSGTDADTCTGTNVNTSGNISGSVSVTPPSPGGNTTYSVSCTNTTGTDVASLVVTSLSLPNLTVVIPQDDVSPTYDPATGNYTYVDVTVVVENSSTAITDTFTVTVEMDSDGNGVYESSQTYFLNGLGSNATDNQIRRFNNVPFGTAVVRATVDSGTDVTESNESDNEDTRNIAQVPPDIEMDLMIDPADLVRGGEDATLDWDTNATFPMTCTLSGPALTTVTFDPSTDGSTGSAVAGPITSKSVYTLACTEPVTSTTYSASVSVETTGSVEEI
jgi:hypothetical protein